MLTRDRIIDMADQLFYEQGFEHTSFAQIAQALGISRGNFYHHFKSKDEILDAVIRHRIVRTNSMLHSWELNGDTPKDRIRSFISILVMNRDKIKRYGCPVGTLCVELAKLEHPAISHANELFTLIRIWLRRQFEQLGRHEDADELAMRILSFSQGVAILSNAFQDEKFICSEVNRLDNWLSSFATSSQNKSEAL